MTKRLKLVLAFVLLAGAALLALPAVWAHSEAGGNHCDSAFLGGDERTTPDVQPLGWSWWPPGMRCQVTPKGGESQERVAPLF